MTDTTSTAVARRETPTLRQQLVPFTPRLLDIAADTGDRAGYVKRQIVLAGVAAEKNSALARCSTKSIALALYRICMAGLDVGVTAHLVPFKGECTAVFDWKGLVALALQSRHVRDVYARAVYAADRFVVEQGLDERLVHEPAWTKDRGEIVAYYAVAKLVGNRATFEVMSAEEVDKIRRASPKPDSDPWMKHRAEMGKKTVVRRLMKRMPQSPALARALAAEEDDIGGDVLAASAGSVSGTLANAAPRAVPADVPAHRPKALAGGDLYAAPAPPEVDAVEAESIDDAEFEDDDAETQDAEYAAARPITPEERAGTLALGDQRAPSRRRNAVAEGA